MKSLWVITITMVLGLTVPAMAKDVPPYSKQDICRACIGALFNRLPSQVRLDGPGDGDEIHLDYVRESDKTYWAYKCRVNNEYVIWGVKEGRWRTHPADDTVTWRNKGQGLEIIMNHSDGSQTIKFFDHNQF